MMLQLLSQAHAGLGRRRGAGRLRAALPLNRLARAWLRSAVVESERRRPDDVTVVIGVRNRADYRLTNALESIRAQTLPAHAVRATVVDYGSGAEAAALTREECRRFGADYVRVAEAPVWSRSRCLNVGIRRATTKFVLVSDVDIVLSPSYLAEALETLRREPLSVVCAAMLDLPPEAVDAFGPAGRRREAPCLEEWKARCAPRLGLTMHPSIATTYTAFFRLVRGLDEYYAVWGCEDLDLMRRFEYLGLAARPPGAEGFYVHQWHPKYEDVPGGAQAEQIARNYAYLEAAHSILRNPRGWGNP